MLVARIVEVALVLGLLVFFARGYAIGLLRSAGTVAGLAAGGVGAFFAIPLVTSVVPDQQWRLAAAIATGLILVVLGVSAGSAIGSRLRRGVKSKPLRGLDRWLGGIAVFVVGALSVSAIAGSVSALGVPQLSRAISDSVVLRSLQWATPEPVEAAIARLRASALDRGLPTVADAFGGITESPGPPDVELLTPELQLAAESVVRIGGTAYACGQNQTGTGFVVAPDRIVTNAHVVAGVENPIVEARNGRIADGRIVFFDAASDLAVIAVSGLEVAPLELGGPLEVGDEAVVQGFPYGGPFVVGGAEVLAVSIENVLDIYGGERSPREVYSIAADVSPGNSGGPLLDTSGDVAGVIFARSASDDQLGFAMTNTELSPLASQAAGLDATVDAGACTAR